MTNYARRDVVGGAVATTLSSGITSSDVSIPITSATGWPTGTNGSFWVVIDRGNAAEEKVLCSSRTGTTLTVASAADRGGDGTSAAAHNAGVAIEHCISKQDIDEANYTTSETVGKVTGAGQLLIGDAANSLAALDASGNAKLIVGNGTTATSVSMSGDTTIDNTGAVTIGAQKVSVAKMTSSATDRLFGRDTAAAGAGEELTVGGGVEFTGTGGIQRSALTGDVTASAGSNTTAIGAGKVLTTMIADSNVTKAKIAAGAVDDSKIATGFYLVTVSDVVPTALTGLIWVETSTGLMFQGDASNDWVCISPQSATVATSQSTTSTTFTNLTTTGPAVTVTTGSKALVRISCDGNCSTANGAVYMGFATSGVTTVAAASNTFAFYTSFAANFGGTFSRDIYVTGLNPGDNTFTAKYQTSTGTGTFANRTITAVGLP